MVERLVWDQEAAGSSPVIPTKIIQRKDVAIMIFTSAAANKMIRQMKEEISSIVSKENKCSVVRYSEGDEPIRPEYSFKETQKKIQEINSKIIKLRHAVNMMNVSTSLPGLDRALQSSNMCAVPRDLYNNVADVLRAFTAYTSEEYEGFRTKVKSYEVASGLNSSVDESTARNYISERIDRNGDWSHDCLSIVMLSGRQRKFFMDFIREHPEDLKYSFKLDQELSAYIDPKGSVLAIKNAIVKSSSRKNHGRTMQAVVRENSWHNSQPVLPCSISNNSCSKSLR